MIFSLDKTIRNIIHNKSPWDVNELALLGFEVFALNFFSDLEGTNPKEAREVIDNVEFISDYLSVFENYGFEEFQSRVDKQFLVEKFTEFLARQLKGTHYETHIEDKGAYKYTMYGVSFFTDIEGNILKVVDFVNSPQHHRMSKSSRMDLH